MLASPCNVRIEASKKHKQKTAFNSGLRFATALALPNMPAVSYVSQTRRVARSSRLALPARHPADHERDEVYRAAHGRLCNAAPIEKRPTPCYRRFKGGGELGHLELCGRRSNKPGEKRVSQRPPCRVCWMRVALFEFFRQPQPILLRRADGYFHKYSSYYLGIAFTLL